MRKNFGYSEIVIIVVLFLMISSAWAHAESVTYKGVVFPLGDISFADVVIDFTPGSSSGERDGSAAIGPPNGEVGPSIIGAKGDVTLGKGGSITLKFTNNFLIDGEGLDLYIYEYGPDVEAFKVEISKDGVEWIDLGIIAGQPTGVDIRNKVNPGDKFSYVRLTDPSPYTPQDPGEIGKSLYYGADIDAVGAIGSEERPDQDGDGIADDDDECPDTPAGVFVDAKGCPPSDTSCTACISAIAPESRGTKTSGVVPLTIEFKDCSYPDPISWDWNFGDGGTSSARDTTWVYQNPGKYSPSLTVTCKNGGKDTISITVEGWDAPVTSCQVSFSVAVNPERPKEVILTPIVPCPHAQAIRWKYGDGFENTYQVGLGSPSDPHVREYSDYGTYTITMEVIFATDTEIASTTIQVNPSGATPPTLDPQPDTGIPSYSTVSQITNSFGPFAISNSGNVYFTDYGKGTVFRVENSGAQTVVVSGIDRPRSPVFDRKGNLYVGSYDGTIQKIAPDGTKRVIASGIWSPQGMGFDAQETLFVACGYDGYIYKIASSGSITKVSSGIPYPVHLGVTGEGFMYVVNNKESVIQAITPGGASHPLVDIGKPINGIAIHGDIIFISYDDTIAQVNSAGVVTKLITGLDNPTSLSVQNDGIYVSVSGGTIFISKG